MRVLSLDTTVIKNDYTELQILYLRGAELSVKIPAAERWWFFFIVR